MVAIESPERSTAAETTGRRLMTAEEFLLLPESLNKRELVNGEVVEMSPVSARHGYLQGEVHARLRQHVRQHRLGAVIVEVGFKLRQNPDLVRAPDVAFISAEQLRQAPLGSGFYEGHPDLAVEIVSPGDKATDIEEKVLSYLAAGAKLVWVVYPEVQIVHVRYPDGTGRVLRGDDALSGEDVLPGFELRLAELFELPAL